MIRGSWKLAFTQQKVTSSLGLKVACWLVISSSMYYYQGLHGQPDRSDFQDRSKCQRPVKWPVMTGQIWNPVWAIVTSVYKDIGIGKPDANTLLINFWHWHCVTDQNNVLISTELDWQEWNCFSLAYYNLYFELWSWPWFKFWNHFSMVPFLKLTDRSGPWPLEALERTLESTQRKNASQAEFFLLRIVLLERPALGQVFL